MMKIRKQNTQRKIFIKRKLEFEDCNNFTEAAQIGNQINYSEKNKIDVDSPKDFIKKLVLKTQRRLKSKRYNDVTEEINKIALALLVLTGGKNALPS